jgi:hypothetical protein
MMRIRSLCGVSVLLAASTACHETRGGEGVGVGRLSMLDSVVLQENDSLYLGAPLHVTPGRDGSLLVSDGLESQVLQFSRTGALIRRFGGAGRGPGELGDPVATALMGDSMLVVAEWGNQRISMFNVATGAFVRSIPHQGLPLWMEARGETLWISNVNIPRRTILSIWTAGDDSMRYLGRVPRPYEESPALMDFHPYATLARSGDTLLVGLTGHQPILLARPDGTLLSTVDLPAVRRRGVPEDIAQRFARNPRRISNEQVASMGSALVALHRLPSGEIAAVHLDVTLRDKLITADGYVSVLSRDRTRACADTGIPLQKDGRPAVAFRGDTLIVVEQRVVAATRAVTHARWYHVDTSACRWVPVASRRAVALR